jgi:peptidoglycan hydrolase-like protein with peptidoglycan-binding domain
MLRWLVPGRPADAIAAFLAAVATAAVLVNALALQPVRHPAPMFGESQSKSAIAAVDPVSPKKTVPATPAPKAAATPTPVPPQRPADTASVRQRSDLVADTQRELTQLGFYEGTVDGLLGPRTTQAIRDFEQSQGLKIGGEPSLMLLDVMRRARGAKPGTTGSVPVGTAPATTGSIATTETRPSTRVLSVQRVLARLGYGPLQMSGLPDVATRGAVEQFERDRGLARTGEISDRLIRELATVTGSPIE